MIKTPINIDLTELNTPTENLYYRVEEFNNEDIRITLVLHRKGLIDSFHFLTSLVIPANKRAELVQYLQPTAPN